MQVLGYFTNPAAAMTSGPMSIPSSWLKGRVLTAGAPGAPTTYTAFTQNGVGGVGTAGGSLLLFSQPILGLQQDRDAARSTCSCSWTSRVACSRPGRTAAR